MLVFLLLFYYGVVSVVSDEADVLNAIMRRLDELERTNKDLALTLTALTTSAPPTEELPPYGYVPVPAVIPHPNKGNKRSVASSKYINNSSLI